jgi:hypothetical protein
VIQLPTRLSDGQIQIARLDGVYTPTFGMNLISLPQLDQLGFHGTWGNGRLSVIGKEGVVMEGHLEYDGDRRRMYRVMTLNTAEMLAGATSRSRNKPTDLMNWHRRMGHADVRVIERMANRGLVEGLAITNKVLQGLCENCVVGKATKHPFDAEVTHETEPLTKQSHLNVITWIYGDLLAHQVGAEQFI